MTNNKKSDNNISVEKENERRKVASIDVAVVMLEYNGYMRVSDISSILKITNPSLIIEKSKISFIVRNFVSSKYCTCAVDKNTYPHRYFLMSTGTYTFKLREKNKIDINKFPLYLKAGTPKIARKEQQRQEKTRKEVFSYALKRLHKLNKDRHQIS
ncbi:hypothetical protein [Rosenbergiella epipactidis]|uniref:hypothetical protein n=1 Tax=Rosenbergiella epipactidis TaxID=1544694 RepID=UPI001F4E9B0A|nr:hypothetical protein [Rosenbergiella epipactidis]